MHARIATFAMAPGAPRAAGAGFDAVAALFRAQPGFLNAWCLSDARSGESGTFSIWESAEAAERAMPGLDARIAELLAGPGTAPSIERDFDVLCEA
jgi:hypothetical protein